MESLAVGLLAQAEPAPMHEPVLGYVLAAVGVAVFYVATRVDTDSSSAHRRIVFRGLLAVGGALLLAGVASGVLGGP